MKIMLVYLCDHEDRNDYYISLLPVGLISIASFLESKGHDVVLANYSHIGSIKAHGEILKMKPDILGISIFTHNKNESNKLIKLFEGRKKFHLTIGGAHASFLAGEYLKRFPAVDSVMKGEGENSFLDLIEDINSGKKERKIYECRRLDDLSAVKLSSKFSGISTGINFNEQFKYLITSRGCPNSCTYCSSPAYWMRKVSYSPVDDIIAEIKYLQNRYGIIYFGIRDDNFTLKKSRVMEFCDKLIKNKIYIMWNCQSRVDTIDFEMLSAMKLSGLEHIQFGVESGSEKILSIYDKKITPDKIIAASEMVRRAGVYLSVYLMCGVFGETKEDVQKTKELIGKILPGDVLVSPVAYYPGTALYNQAVKKGLISDSDWFKKTRGIYLRNDTETESMIDDILKYSSIVREKAWYRDRDFDFHRKNIGSDSWVTEILHGDYKLDCDKMPQARALYAKAAKIAPLNPWPYLRTGKAYFFEGDFESALKSYIQVTDLVPNYYGGWLKSAESGIASGKLELADECIKKAKELNTYDKRIDGVINALSRNIKNRYSGKN
ncbi:MAG: radical SAM protein [Spirochaetes bacterium]|nr:radical SAM protein [Spirochaetota bacterium]